MSEVALYGVPVGAAALLGVELLLDRALLFLHLLKQIQFKFIFEKIQFTIQTDSIQIQTDSMKTVFLKLIQFKPPFELLRHRALLALHLLAIQSDSV